MKIKFVPQNIEVEIGVNESVLHVAQNNGVHIQSVCKGVPSCAECRIRVVGGEHNVLPPSPKEQSLIGSSYFIDGRRLSCQLKCFGDITVDTSDQLEKAGRALQSKRPRGAKTAENFDAASSHAKHGNIIFESGAPGTAELQEPMVAGAVPVNKEYEETLMQAEKQLFEEETKRQLSELKSRRNPPPQNSNQRTSNNFSQRTSQNSNQNSNQNSSQNSQAGGPDRGKSTGNPNQGRPNQSPARPNQNQPRGASQGNSPSQGRPNQNQQRPNQNQPRPNQNQNSPRGQEGNQGQNQSGNQDGNQDRNRGRDRRGKGE